MPFNALGVFQRLFNWKNDRDAGVKILAERVDEEMDGFADAINALTDCQIPYRAPLKAPYGTAGNPAYSFGGDTDTGVYRPAPNKLAFSVGAVEKMLISSGGVEVGGNTVWHGGNDGAASGLDADLLDGEQGSYYQNADNLNAGTVPTDRLSGAYNISISGNAATADNSTTADNASNSASLGGIEAAKFFHKDQANHIFRMGSGASNNFDGITFADGPNMFTFKADADEVGFDTGGSIISAGALRLTSVKDAGLTTTKHALQIGPDDNCARFDTNEICLIKDGAELPVFWERLLDFVGDDAGLSAFARPAIRKTAPVQVNVSAEGGAYMAPAGAVMSGVLNNNGGIINYIYVSNLQIQRGDGVWITATEEVA